VGALTHRNGTQSMQGVTHCNGMLGMSIINVIFLTNVENCGDAVITLLLRTDGQTVRPAVRLLG